MYHKINISYKNINYKPYVDEIISLMYSQDRDRYHRCDHNNYFSKRSRCIGKELHKLGGYNALFTILNILQDELMTNEYSTEYLHDLREIEFSFSGICDEFQA